MSQDLKLALTLSLKDQLIGPLQRAQVDATRSIEGIAAATGKLGAASDQASTKLNQLGARANSISGGEGIARLRSSVAGVGNAADFSRFKVEQLSTTMEKLRGIAGQAGTAMLGFAAAQRMISIPVNAFASLEDANSALKVTMMKKGGAVSENYGAIQKIAVDLGNKLPGSTKDFVGSANELLSLGVNENAVVHGGLESAAHLGVVLKMPPQQAAETVAKMREAYGLKDAELPGMADEIQRNRFAFGMNPSDLLLAAKYSAPTLNTLGLSGKRNMSEILTLQGMANKKGMDGSQFGTNFDMLLQRLAKGPLMIEEAKKGMKAEARDLMDSAGIKFNFYDDKGKLKTEDGSAVKGLVRELEKLELIRQKLGDKAAMEVSGAVFGQEAARPAQILAQYGVKGFDEARADVADQATLEERTTQSLTTLNSKIEATSGSFTNLMASMGTQLGEGSKSRLDKLNDWLGDATGFADKHPGASTAAVLGGAGVAGWGIWKSGSAIWNALTGRGAAGAGAAAGEASSLKFPALESGSSAGSAGWLGKILSTGSKALGPLMLLESLTQPSEEDIAALKRMDTQDAMANGGHRGKGFDDPRRLDMAAVNQSSPGDGATMLASAISRLEAIANRPVVVTLDGRVLAESLNHQNSKAWRRN